MRDCSGHLDPAADTEVLGGLIVTTHRGREPLAKAGVDSMTLNRISTAAIDSIALDPVTAETATASPCPLPE